MFVLGVFLLRLGDLKENNQRNVNKLINWKVSEHKAF